MKILNRFTENLIIEIKGDTLRNADLRGADLRYADLRYTDLRYADLHGADLRGAKNIPFIPLACPSEGEFTGWKKVMSGGIKYLIKLLIPEDARRCSATTNKCRCDKAKVLDITRIGDNEHAGSVTNKTYPYAVTTYKVGEMVYPDSFDDNRFNECSHGIHFFINRQEAINY